MRIDGIETWREPVPLTRPYAIAGQSFDAVELFFLRLIADDGTEGLGSASPAEFVTGETLEDTAAALDADALGWLVGGDPRRLLSLTRQAADRMTATPAARAAVDMALWDLHGKALGAPVVDLLGRRHDVLPTSITIGILDSGETLSEAAEHVGHGFCHLKIKLGDDIDEDLERLTKLRERFGTAVELRVDVNQGYGKADVGRLLAAAGPLGLELIEQPLPRDGDDTLSELAPKSPPLAADESLHDIRDALRQAEDGSPYGIFNIKLMKCGGVSPALSISAVAEAAGRTLMWGCMDESRISIAAALHAAYGCPGTRYLDLDGSFDLARDPAEGGFDLREGHLHLLDAPGLGVSLPR